MAVRLRHVLGAALLLACLMLVTALSLFSSPGSLAHQQRSADEASPLLPSSSSSSSSPPPLPPLRPGWSERLRAVPYEELGEPGGCRRAQGPDGRRLAYALYATDDTYAALAAVNARRLHRLGKRRHVDVVAVLGPRVSGAARAALRSAGVCAVLERGELQTHYPGTETWLYSPTKVRILGLTDYDAVAYFDSDGLVLADTHALFGAVDAEATPAAMVLGYWLPNRWYITMLGVFAPAERWERAALEDLRRTGHCDGEILNRVFTGRTRTLPNAALALSSFMDARYPDLGRLWPGRTPEQVLGDALYMHASQPTSKPWRESEGTVRDYAEHAPLMAQFIDTLCSELTDVVRAHSIPGAASSCAGWSRWKASLLHQEAQAQTQTP
eukprot:m51a1_g3900 hypothetical protein (384) ;mRNA; f:103683-104834